MWYWMIIWDSKSSLPHVWSPSRPARTSRPSQRWEIKQELWEHFSLTFTNLSMANPHSISDSPFWTHYQSVVFHLLKNSCLSLACVCVKCSALNLFTLLSHSTALEGDVSPVDVSIPFCLTWSLSLLFLRSVNPSWIFQLIYIRVSEFTFTISYRLLHRGTFFELTLC